MRTPGRLRGRGARRVLARTHPAVVAACTMASAERFAQRKELTGPAGGLVAASAASGQLVSLTHLTGPVPAARTACWCVHAVCAVAHEGLPVVAASELVFNEDLEALAAGQPAARELEALVAPSHGVSGGAGDWQPLREGRCRGACLGPARMSGVGFQGSALGASVL
jgi:hypothetical protein